MEINVLGVVVVIGVLAFSITFHEFMHGFVAYKLGDNTAKYSGRLTLNPLKHIDPFLTIALPLLLFLIGAPPFGAAKPVPFNPSHLRNGETGMAMVAIAGPLTNLVLAAFVGIWMQLFALPPAVFEVFLLFVIVNVGFFIFNMIPFPPLDGSRLLYVFAPEPLRQGMRMIEQMGLMAVAIFLFVAFPFISPLLGRAISLLVGLLTGFTPAY